MYGFIAQYSIALHFMAKSQQTFAKSEKEKKRRKKKKEKAERREQRKQEKEERGKLTFEEQIRYVDFNGNLTETMPDPAEKVEIKVENIMLGAAQREEVEGERVRNGIVKFFNHEKGYGFINDLASQDSIFVHINNAYQEIGENDKVTFEVESGPKGPVAVKVVKTA